MPRSSDARLALLLCAVVASGGCLVDPAALPDDTLWRCSTSTDCPEGWSCDVGRSLCVAPGVPRVVGSPLLSHGYAGPAREVTLRFSVDRDVAAEAAAVTLVDAIGEPAPGGAFTHVSGGGDVRELVFSLLAADVDEGVYEVLISLSSAGGGLATFPAGPLVVDATPPVVLADAVLVEPVLADALSPVTVRLAASEPLENDGEAVPLPGVRAFASGDDEAGLSFSAVRLSSTELRFTLDGDGAGGARASGTYTVFVSGLVDLAGNESVDDETGLGVSLGGFEVDDTAPLAAIASLSPSVLSPAGDDPTVRACLDIADEHLREGVTTGPASERPFELMLGPVDLTARCVSPGDPAFLSSCEGHAYSCSYPFAATDFPAGALPEQGPLLVTLRATDQAGNRAEAGDAIIYDVRPPSLFNLHVAIEPAADNVILDPTRLAVGSTLSVSFNTDESVRGQGTPQAPLEDPVVEVTCGAAAYPLVRRQPFASTFFHYTWRVEEGAPDGACTAEVWMRDVAGNEVTLPLASESEILVDTTAPPAGTIDAAGLVHVRVPWGFVDLPAVGGEYRAPFQVLHAVSFLDDPELSLIPPELIDASADDLRFVRVFDRAAGGSELGRVTPVYGPPESDAGTPDEEALVGWTPKVLATRDSPALYVSVVDSAGNESPRQRIDRGLWIASLGGKVAGSVVENPHSMWALPYFRGTLDVTGAEEAVPESPIAAPDEDGAPGANDPGDRAAAVLQRLEGGGTFRRVADARAPRPPALEEATLSYDSARGRAALIGGSDGSSPVASYYELTSGGWDLRCDGVAFDLCFTARPPVRRRHAAVYEPGTALTFLGGGLLTANDAAAGNGGIPSDLWVFTGSGFVGGEACPGADASCVELYARHGHAMLAHPDGGRLLFYGGCGDEACEERRGDLTLVDVAAKTITTLCDPGEGCAGPDPRYDAAVTVDPSSRTVLVVGGCTRGAPGACSSAPLDAWVFDLDAGSWTALEPTGDVPVLTPTGAAYARFATMPPPAGDDDTAPRHALAIAGVDALYDVEVRGGDAVFTRIETVDLEGDGAPSLSSVTSLAIAADPMERRVLLAAGDARWALHGREDDGAVTYSWRLLDRAGALESPESGNGRSGAQLALDYTTGRVILQGGRGPFGTPFDDTWSFSGARWKLVCDGAIGTCGPAGDGHVVASAYRAGGSRVLLQDDAATQVFDDDGPDFWPALTTTGSAPPTGRAGRAFAQLSDAGHVLLFGGRNAIGVKNQEAYVLTPSGRWIDVTSSAGAPAARSDAMMTWDPGVGRAVLFGGCGNALVLTPCTLEDTWYASFDAATEQVTWEPLGVVGPAARRRAAFAFDYMRGVSVLFGGEDAKGRRLDDVWELSAGVWRERVVADVDGDGSPGPRADVAFAPDGIAGGLLTFGGSGGLPETWRYEGGALASPAHVALFELGAASLPAGTAVDTVIGRFLAGGTSVLGAGVGALVWEQGRWRVTGGAAASDDEPGVVVAPATGALAGRLPTGPTSTLAFAVLPGPNLDGVSTVTTLYADVLVLYTLPNEP